MTEALAIIPAPLLVEQHETGFRLTPDTPVVASHPDVAPVAESFRDLLGRSHGIQLPLHTQDSNGPAIRLDVVPADPDLAELPPTEGIRADHLSAEAEQYGLTIDATGVRIWATHPAGIHRGLTSLVQLIDRSLDLPGVRILDAPRYAWRGLSLDVVRTFLDRPTVESVIDLLDRYKFNVLHLHLTDDQGWRLEIDGWPELTTKGASGAVGDRPGGFYTQQDFAAIVEYAAGRFITVVGEFDMPGHAGALLTAYQEFSRPAEPDEQWPTPVARLDDSNPRLWELVTDVLSQFARLTGARFVHLGGDEAFGLSDEFHHRFLNRAIDIAHGLGVQVIGWQEAARAELGAGDIAQHWIDFADRIDEMKEQTSSELPAEIAEALMESFRKAPHDVPAAVARDVAIVLSPVSYFYLDRPYGEPATDPEQEERRLRLGLEPYGRVSLEEAFSFDPGELVQVPATIAGLEAAIWCESIVDRSDLEFLLLPRLPGIAERAWAPAETPATWSEFRARLAREAPVWSAAGRTWFAAPSVDWEAR